MESLSLLGQTRLWRKCAGVRSGDGDGSWFRSQVITVAVCVDVSWMALAVYSQWAVAVSKLCHDRRWSRGRRDGSCSPKLGLWRFQVPGLGERMHHHGWHLVGDARQGSCFSSMSTACLSRPGAGAIAFGPISTASGRSPACGPGPQGALLRRAARLRLGTWAVSFDNAHPLTTGSVAAAHFRFLYCLQRQLVCSTSVRENCALYPTVSILLTLFQEIPLKAVPLPGCTLPDSSPCDKPHILMHATRTNP